MLQEVAAELELGLSSQTGVRELSPKAQLRGFEPLWLVVLILRQHYFQLDFLLFSR